MCLHMAARKAHKSTLDKDFVGTNTPDFLNGDCFLPQLKTAQTLKHYHTSKTNVRTSQHRRTQNNMNATTAFCPQISLPGAYRCQTLVTTFATRPRRRRPLTAVKCSLKTAPRTDRWSSEVRTPIASSPTSQAQTPSARPPPPPNNRTPDYHANLGTVIDALCTDYPNLLTEEPDLHIFRDDVILSDVTGYRLIGKDAYRTVLFLLRAHARLFLTSASLHIENLYYHDDIRPAVHVRWRMRATPRVWASARRDVPVIVDGLCIYYIDDKGWVEHHTFETRVRGDRPVMHPVFRHILSTGHVAVETGCALSPLEIACALSLLELSLSFSSVVSYLSNPTPLLEAMYSSADEGEELGDDIYNDDDDGAMVFDGVVVHNL